MGMRFIFMLTRNDETVEEAEQHLASALAADVHHIGFKDVGLPFDRLKKLNETIKAGGATSYLEVVSLDEASEVASARQRLILGLIFFWGALARRRLCLLLMASQSSITLFRGVSSGTPVYWTEPLKTLLPVPDHCL
ncbi:hypothetical protein ACH42_15280 [Endozoicomonas sp. (ex Bugula neritina AB1)]|nr:hypothetical protein ACH42_15280 [Endozoicomonas sp. (ex Bugula neritina AB1)]